MRRAWWIVAFLVGLAAVALGLLPSLARAAGLLALIAGLAVIAGIVRRPAKEAAIGSLAALALIGGGVTHLVRATPPHDRVADLRRALEEEGFSDVELVPAGEDAFELEATRGGERCTGELHVAGGEVRRAIRCASAEPLEVIERDCQAGDLPRCADAAATVRGHAPIDWPRATASSVRACEGGLGRECLYVAMARELGERGLPRDLDEARRLYQLACDAGSPPACTRGASLGAAAP